VVNITVGNAIINGTIDGGGQTTADTISFNGNATQAEVNAAQAFVGCNPCAGTLTAGGQSYTFLNFEAFINLLTVIAAGGGGGGQVVTVSFDSGSLAPSGPQVICDDGAVKVFHLPDGDVEVFSGFSSALPNGFLVGRVFSAQIPNVLRFQDRGPRNPGWYVGLTHQGGGSYIGQAYDQFNNPIGGGCHFDGPSSSSFVINANQQATGNSQQRISQLEAENAALEARIAELEALLNQ
jgi:hypothetical protein